MKEQLHLSQERLNTLSPRKVFKELTYKDSFVLGTMVLNQLLSNYWKLHNLSNGIDITWFYCQIVWLLIQILNCQQGCTIKSNNTDITTEECKDQCVSSEMT